MFERLAAVVGDLKIPADVDALAEVLSLSDRLSAKVSAAVGAVDAAGGWEADGATSMTASLRRAGRTSREASCSVRTAKKLRSLPVLSGAWKSGELSSGQVQAVLASVAERHLELFAEHESSVVPTLVGLSVTDTARVAQTWAAHAEALDDEPEPTEPSRALHLSETLDGRRELSGHLDAEAGEVLARALRLAETKDLDGEPARSAPERRADASKTWPGSSSTTSARSSAAGTGPT